MTTGTVRAVPTATYRRRPLIGAALALRNQPKQHTWAVPASRIPRSVTGIGNRYRCQAYADHAEDGMQATFASTIRPKLDAIDHIRPLVKGSVPDLLPGIVVVGDQSTGKSSLLESISGIALPRGENLVTRCPLQLALRSSKDDSEGAHISYTARDGSEVKKDISLKRITSEIEEATNNIAGTSKNVVDEIIHLEVFKPEAPDLTLVDLPGIVRMPVGDQPQDIEVQVKSLINKHASGGAQVILVVLPVTADFATQEALRIASELDPSGSRTIGVFTKIDIDPSSLVKQMTEAQADGFCSKLGYVAVLNRSPEDLKRSTSATQLAAKESKFFQSQSKLRRMPDEARGLPALISKLTKVQAERIMEYVPILKSKVRAEEHVVHKRIMNNRGLVSTQQEAQLRMVDCLAKMQQHFARLLEAAYTSNDKVDKQLDHHLAPRMFELSTSYGKEVWKAIGGKTWLYGESCLQEIRKFMNETRGVSLPDSLSDRAVDYVYEAGVWSKLHIPARAFLCDAHELVEAAMLAVAEAEFDNYPNLASRVKDLVQDLMSQSKEMAAKDIDSLMERLRIVHTAHQNYWTMLSALDALAAAVIKPSEDVLKSAAGPNPAILQQIRAQHTILEVPDPIAVRSGMDMTEKDAEDQQVLNAWFALIDAINSQDNLSEQAFRRNQFRLASFTQVVLASLTDEVPKIVRTQLMNKVRHTVQQDMLKHLLDSDCDLLGLMTDPQKAAKMQFDKKLLEDLQKAGRELSKI